MMVYPVAWLSELCYLRNIAWIESISNGALEWWATLLRGQVSFTVYEILLG